MSSNVRTILAFVCLLVAMPSLAAAQYVQVTMPVNKLPTEHAYQKTLRDHMATLKAEDFAIDKAPIRHVEPDSEDEQFRFWLLTQQNMTRLNAVNILDEAFTLASIESQQSLKLPGSVSDSQALAWLAKWDYAGNPYHGNKAVMRRAFVLAAIDMVMLDYLYEHNPQGADRADYLGGNLIWIGYTYSVVKDALPDEVRAAFHAGIKKHVMRITGWGPKGQMTDMDLFAAVGLAYIDQNTDDAELKKACAAYTKLLFTDERFYHPAGYFVDNGCFDTSYNGISLYFGLWAALMSDWPEVDKAMHDSHVLRAYLCFPDPDGVFTGPSQMSSRTSAPPSSDQWRFNQRLLAAPIVSDSAFWDVDPPSEAALKSATKLVVNQLNTQLEADYAQNDARWREGHWSRVINFAHEHYQPGHWAKWKKLAEQDSPLLKPMYKRGENFTREFEGAFVIAKRDGYAAAVHTGPVGRQAGHKNRPYGFGGGELSTYWTPKTGTVIVGRRRGVQGHTWDKWEEWKLWPVHAVTGLTDDGKYLTSSRIRQPNIVPAGSWREFVATGPLPVFDKAELSLKPSGHTYTRRFTYGDRDLTVATRIDRDSDAASPTAIAELYETLPVMLRERSNQPASTTEFRVGDAWREATTQATGNVTAVRISRFDGAVVITFKQPREVMLSPDVWTDGYQTRVECRTVLVSLPADGDGVRAVSYTIAPAAE